MGSEDKTFVSWSGVKNADGYVVKIDNQEYEVDGTNFSSEELPAQKKDGRKVSVKARSKKGEKRDSKFSRQQTFIKLPRPENFVFKNGVISWDIDIENEKKFVDIYLLHHVESDTWFRILNGEDPTTIMKYNFTTIVTYNWGLSLLTSHETNTVRIKAMAMNIFNHTIIDSCWTEIVYSDLKITPNQVPTVVEPTIPAPPGNIRLDERVIRWDPVDNAEGHGFEYNIELLFNGHFWNGGFVGEATSFNLAEEWRYGYYDGTYFTRYDGILPGKYIAEISIATYKPNMYLSISDTAYFEFEIVGEKPKILEKYRIYNK